jgi:hypothetical protein
MSGGTEAQWSIGRVTSRRKHHALPPELLKEAVRLFAGTEGLETLARENGAEVSRRHTAFKAHVRETAAKSRIYDVRR